MEKQAFYKNLFLAGAIWNWAATLLFGLGYPFLFPLFNMAEPRYPVFFLLFLALAFVFGIGYFWVSRDISRNHAIVVLGVIGKLIVFGAFLWAGIAGQIAGILVGAGVVDLVFAVLFIEFLASWSGTGSR